MSEESCLKTEAFSILGLIDRAIDSEETAPCHRDLNLLQIFDKMCARWGRGVRKYFLHLPDSAREESFRRAVYADIKKEPVYRALMAFTDRLAAVNEIRREKEHVSDPMQKTVWRIREEGAYCDAYGELAEDLSKTELSSEGMKAFYDILSGIIGSDAYRSGKEQNDRIRKEIRELRFLITYEKERIRVELGELPGAGKYEQWLDGVSGSDEVKMQNPFAADIPLTDLEQACLEVLKKKKPEFFRQLKEVSEQKEEFGKPVLRRFEEEIPFYLAALMYQRDMEAAGFRFTTPDTGEGCGLSAEGLYDLALATASLQTGRKVVANAFSYEDGEKFFVLTGPNQGGKTTFARSLGQLVYLTKLGLDVPAEAAGVPFFPDIVTHFSVEESVQTGRGKLMEELVRLAPMMKERKSGSYVVINELFTTAANYDAQIMGKRVLKHFINLGCMGIYVTHLTELAEQKEGVVSLRAMLDEHGVQTFEIRRGEAKDMSSAATQVNKYRLSYEQLKERL